MSHKDTMQIFKDAIARWQLTLSSNDASNRILPPEFVSVMFRLAAEFGSVSCRALDKETLCFVIGEVETRTVRFTPSHGIRVVLAAVAYVPKHCSKVFNVYGDSAEITFEINGQHMPFHVETANTNGKPLFFHIFHIRKL